MANYMSLKDYAATMGMNEAQAAEFLKAPIYSSYLLTKDGNTLVSLDILSIDTAAEQEQVEVRAAEIERLQVEIRELHRQIEERDRRIEEKDKQITEFAGKFAELAQQAQVLTSQAQVLHLSEQASKSKESGELAELAPPPKKSFFKRFFGD